MVSKNESKSVEFSLGGTSGWEADLGTDREGLIICGEDLANYEDIPRMKRMIEGK